LSNPGIETMVDILKSILIYFDWSAKLRFGRSGAVAFRKRPSAFVANPIYHPSWYIEYSPKNTLRNV
jgi:hypothetical protein